MRRSNGHLPVSPLARVDVMVAGKTSVGEYDEARAAVGFAELPCWETL